MLLTGFPAGMLACNCYVLAPRQGSDAIVVDPGQRAFGPLRRILDENRLTPAAVLLTHGHIDHIWSAQKVADTFGCPVYIHPADRSMLTDPGKGMGRTLGAVIGAFVMGVMNNGMSILGVGIDWQQAIKGSVLLIAVFFDVYNKNKS